MAQLTPEQLQQFKSMFMDYGWRQQQQAAGNGGLEYLDPATGMYVIPQFTTRQGAGPEDQIEEISGFSTYDSNHPLAQLAREKKDNFYNKGMPLQGYDAQGNFIRETLSEGGKKNSAMDYLLPIAMMAAPFALTAMGVGGVAGGSGAGFIGEGAASGIPGWDAALSQAPSWSQAAGYTLPGIETVSEGFGPQFEGLSQGLDQGLTNPFLEQPWTPTPNASPLDFSGLPPGGAPTPLGEGVTPPNPFAPGSPGNSLIPGISDKVLGGALTVGSGLLGGQGQEQSKTETRDLDPRLAGPVFNDLIPKAQGLLSEQMPQAKATGAGLLTTGTGLLQTPLTGNGFDKIKLNAPTTGSNPYLASQADDIQRRTQEMLGQGMADIQSRYVGGGGYGNSRQGVAQGLAAGKAADSLSGNLANLFGQAYDADQNRSLQQYGLEGQFYGAERGRDLAQIGLGSGLLDQGMQTQWQPLLNTAEVFRPFTPNGSATSSTKQGGGWGGAAGGLLGGASLANKFGWWS